MSESIEPVTTEPLTGAEHHFLHQAAAYLEHPSFLMQVANVAGKPAEVLLKFLPDAVHSLA